MVVDAQARPVAAGAPEMWTALLSDAELHLLAEEQAALRRVATLVARGIPEEELFAAVTEEVGRVLLVDVAALSRYESDNTMTNLAIWRATGGTFPAVGKRHPLGGQNTSTLVFETGRPARIDAYPGASDSIATVISGVGVRSSVGAPISVEGRLWGVIHAASTREQRLPADAETRLASFTELVAMAIANAESRVALARLVEEQAALRRVATLVARGARAGAGVRRGHRGGRAAASGRLRGPWAVTSSTVRSPSSPPGASPARRPPRSAPVEARGEEPQHDRRRDGSFSSNRELCRCLGPDRRRRPQGRCPHGGRGRRSLSTAGCGA